MEINRSNINEIVTKASLRPDKDYGQNFLVEPSICDKIVSALNIAENDSVLEVGPGLGSLTHFISLSNAKYDAVDIDLYEDPFGVQLAGRFQVKVVIAFCVGQDGNEPSLLQAAETIIDCFIGCIWKKFRQYIPGAVQSGINPHLQIVNDLIHVALITQNLSAQQDPYGNLLFRYGILQIRVSSEDLVISEIKGTAVRCRDHRGDPLGSRNAQHAQ